MMLELGEGYRLRHTEASDHAAMRLVCLRTGNAGRDATASEDDPDLLGTIYAVPYQVFSPEFAFVVDGPAGVCGYVLGTPDSARFYRWMTETWLPPLAAGLSDPGPDENRWRGSDWARRAIHHPRFAYPEVLHPYPAHGHIDLLEEARGRRIGQRGMEHLMAALAAAGAPGLHLQVSPANTGAQAFYRRLGFAPLRDPTLPRDTSFMVRALPYTGRPRPFTSR